MTTKEIKIKKLQESHKKFLEYYTSPEVNQPSTDKTWKMLEFNKRMLKIIDSFD